METERSDPHEVLGSIERSRERARTATRPFAWLLLADAALAAGYVGTILAMGVQPSVGVPIIMVLAIALAVVTSSGLLVRGTASRFASRWEFWTARQVILVLIMVVVVALTVLSQNVSPLPVWIAPALAGLSFLVLAYRPISTLARAPRADIATNGWNDVQTTTSARVWTVGLAIVFSAMTAFVVVPVVSIVFAGLGLLAAIASPGEPSKRRGLVHVGASWGTWQWSGFFLAALVAYAVATLSALGITVNPLVAGGAGFFVLVAISVPALVGRR